MQCDCAVVLRSPLGCIASHMFGSKDGRAGSCPERRTAGFTGLQVRTSIFELSYFITFRGSALNARAMIATQKRAEAFELPIKNAGVTDVPERSQTVPDVPERETDGYREEDDSNWSF